MIKDVFSKNISALLSEDQWLICQDEYNPKQNLKYETLFALTNGYMGTRGSYEEGTKISLPANYINGVFDRSEAFMRELANTASWVGIKLYVERSLIGVEDCEILEFKRVLDMKKALLAKRMVLRDSEGRETLIEGYRFLSRKDVHRSAIKLFVTPLNYSGLMELENIVDGSVVNFIDFPRFRTKHMRLVENSGMNRRGCYIEAATRDFGLHVGTGACMRIYVDDPRKSVIKTKKFSSFGEQAVEFMDFNVEQNHTVQIDKYAVVYTGREVPNSGVKDAVEKGLCDFAADTLKDELKKHCDVYEKLWKIANVEIDGDPEIDKALRFNIFHLMSTASKDDSRINLGAKLLHGEEYGGHAFWDTEIFMLPFFTYVFPDTARNLLKYRYHLLDKARENARSNGYSGAKYPWESADTGDEECPDWTIEPDGTCYRCYVAMYEHHVTADIAFGLFHYYRVTKDMNMLLEFGAEILLETARFWVSRCEYNSEFDRYEIKAVTGPDEWHEPVDNNCYTNYLARWNISRGLEVAEILKEKYAAAYEDLSSRIVLNEEELVQWKTVRDKIYIPFNSEDKLMEQFQGYFKLTDVVIRDYDENDMPLRPKELKNMRASRTQIIKQADVVMLMLLLGEEFDEEVKRINYEYYEKRCLHRSSLSPSVHSIMGLHVKDSKNAYKYLRRSALVDLNDNQGNSREGIHGASAGGTWQAVICGFGGMNIDRDGILSFDPWFPEHWKKLAYKIYWRNSLLQVKIEKNHVNVSVLEGAKDGIKIKVHDKLVEISS